jgi:hypothetical protein
VRIALLVPNGAGLTRSMIARMMPGFRQWTVWWAWIRKLGKIYANKDGYLSKTGV